MDKTNTFKTLLEVPEPIREYYTEVYKYEPLLTEGGVQVYMDEPFTYEGLDGETVNTTRPVAQFHDVMYVVLKDFGETQDSIERVMELNKPPEILDKFLGFVNNGIDKDFHDAYLSWYNTCIEDCWESWEEDEPVRKPYMSLESYSAYSKWQKMYGVEFDGVMCSATSKDDTGLRNYYSRFKEGYTTVWLFDNSSELTLTPENIDDFMNVWSPFRESFFKSTKEI